jgi:hypothetical protein
LQKKLLLKKQLLPKLEKKKNKELKKVTEEDIRKKAEEIYLHRLANDIPGDADSDWAKAEKELLE